MRLVVLFSLFVLAVSLTVVPIDRVASDTLSYADFDEKYLDQRPVILTGTSICPRDIKLEHVSKHCHGECCSMRSRQPLHNNNLART